MASKLNRVFSKSDRGTLVTELSYKNWDNPQTKKSESSTRIEDGQTTNSDKEFSWVKKNEETVGGKIIYRKEK